MINKKFVVNENKNGIFSKAIEVPITKAKEAKKLNTYDVIKQKVEESMSKRVNISVTTPKKKLT